MSPDQMRELSQFLRAIGEDEFPHPRSIWYQWWEWHKAHPDVYVYLMALCHQLLRQGWQHYGVRPLCEVVRWHFQIDYKLGEEFKLNDHYLSRYARLIMHEHPEMDGFFELRELQTP